ncbi:MAG: MaoC family dehydratase [Rubricoccaceae bacterium]|nr:MaoC family dehydratase [Rubricoccaceae bacterium]
MPDFPLDAILATQGQELGASSWRTVDQELIDAFAEATGDHQWIHVDPERAARESPFGSTIAHGLLTLSLMPALRAEIGGLPTEGVGRVINYGYDEVRFLAPVTVGSRIRLRAEVLEARPRARGALVKTRNTMEIEGGAKPAMVADSLVLLFP